MPDVNALFEANPEGVAIDSLTFKQYHSTCRRAGYRNSASPCANVSLGTISVSSLDESRNRVLLASIASCQSTPHQFDWDLWRRRLPARKVGEDGWTRYEAEDASGTEVYCVMTMSDNNELTLLSQANHIFHCNQISSNFNAYVLVRRVSFEVIIPTIRKDALRGYLFLCPLKAFETGPSSFKWPDCPAYRSLDPSGIDRLSTEDATRHGFPAFQLSTQLDGPSWNDSVYAGLRQFHQAKGFDPESQDVARHCGYPLYEVSSGRDSVFAHFDDEDSSESDDLQSTAPEDDVPVERDDKELDERTSIHDVTASFIYDAESAISQTLTVTMSIQLMLILFVILCSVYDAVW